MSSIFDMIKDWKRRTFADESPVDADASQEPASYDMPDDPHGFSMGLKRKRRAVMMKNMLVDAGYGDLAKTINIKET